MLSNLLSSILGIQHITHSPTNYTTFMEKKPR